MKTEATPLKYALAGNPNCGKTTLFNALTGGKARVGNWPGVTVEKRSGRCKKTGAEIIDLPGIYSLSPYSPEEVIARDYILDEKPDLIINIVDATNLERNLYLTTQILETDCPVVVALNMTDMAAKRGIKIAAHKLEEALGVPVMPICAVHGEGLEALIKKAAETAGKPRQSASALENGDYAKHFAEALEILETEKLPHPKFAAVKALESGAEASGLKSKLSGFAAAKLESLRKNAKLPEEFGGDFEAVIANERYAHIEKNYSSAIERGKDSGKLTVSDRLDRVLTSRLWGLPIFFAMMFAVFHVTFGEDFLYLGSLGVLEEGLASPGVYLLGLTEVLMEWIGGGASAILEFLKAPEWMGGLIIDGVLGGVGAVLSFMPQILLLFLFLSILEDSGYMARAAFLMDRLLRRFGLSGKAFLPLLMCFGCMVPAVMGARTLENMRERKLMIMIAPFFSCGAKLPIWAMFAMAIFPDKADITVFAIYMLGIVTAIGAALLLKLTILKGAASAFVMELPPYHLPLLKNVLGNLWDKFKYYIYRAGTIIAGAAVVIWTLANFSFTFDAVEANSRESMLGIMGGFIQPIFQPLGFAEGDAGWRAVVAALTGLIAKEMVVSTLGVLYNPSVEGDALEDEAASTALAVSLAAVFSPLAAVSFMAFNLLSVPCMAAVAAAHAQLGGGKWTWITIAFWISTAWIVSFIIFQIGSLCGIGI